MTKTLNVNIDAAIIEAAKTICGQSSGLKWEDASEITRQAYITTASQYVLAAAPLLVQTVFDAAEITKDYSFSFKHVPTALLQTDPGDVFKDVFELTIVRRKSAGKTGATYQMRSAPLVEDLSISEILYGLQSAYRYYAAQGESQ